MAKYAARAERPCPIEIDAANRRAERISDVDTSYVVPLKDLPDLPSGTTSQRTGDHADYAYRADRAFDVTDLDAARAARDAVREMSEHSAHPSNPSDPDDDLTDEEAVEALLKAVFTSAHPVYDGHVLIPEPFHHIARFPLTAMGGGKILSNGSFEFTLKVDSSDIEKVLPLYRKRQDGLLFYVDFYALPIADIPEGFRLG